MKGRVPSFRFKSHLLKMTRFINIQHYFITQMLNTLTLSFGKLAIFNIAIWAYLCDCQAIIG